MQTLKQMQTFPYTVSVTISFATTDKQWTWYQQANSMRVHETQAESGEIYFPNREMTNELLHWTKTAYQWNTIIIFI